MIRVELDRMLERKNMTRYQLSKLTGIRYQIIDNYYKNRVIRYDSYVLDRICDVLQCDVSDIIRYHKE